MTTLALEDTLDSLVVEAYRLDRYDNSLLCNRYGPSFLL